MPVPTPASRCYRVDIEHILQEPKKYAGMEFSAVSPVFPDFESLIDYFQKEGFILQSAQEAVLLRIEAKDKVAADPAQCTRTAIFFSSNHHSHWWAAGDDNPTPELNIVLAYANGFDQAGKEGREWVFHRQDRLTDLALRDSKIELRHAPLTQGTIQVQTRQINGSTEIEGTPWGRVFMSKPVISGYMRLLRHQGYACAYFEMPSPDYLGSLGIYNCAAVRPAVLGAAQRECNTLVCLGPNEYRSMAADGFCGRGVRYPKK